MVVLEIQWNKEDVKPSIEKFETYERAYKELKKQLSKLQTKVDNLNSKYVKLLEKAEIKETDAVKTKLSSVEKELKANEAKMQSLINQIGKFKI